MSELCQLLRVASRRQVEWIDPDRIYGYSAMYKRWLCDNDGIKVCVGEGSGQDRSTGVSEQGEYHVVEFLVAVWLGDRRRYPHSKWSELDIGWC